MSTILQIALPVPLPRLFDYRLPKTNCPDNLSTGCRVKVPFGARTLIGILIRTTDRSDCDPKKLKHAIEILDHTPVLTKPIFTLCEWMQAYYHEPFGSVLAAALPRHLRLGKTLAYRQRKSACLTNINLSDIQSTDPLTLNSEQEKAYYHIVAHLDTFHVSLLHGITGSGKTEVYLQIMQKVLDQNQQCLVLIPEIGLTPQTLERFQARFQEPIAILHSKMTDRERFDNWLLAFHEKARIVIGTRSAVFTPLPNLGIIIIDEEHDASFKQSEGVRYCARALSLMRAKERNIPVILGSATPSLETWFNAQNNRFTYLNLSKRAGTSSLSEFHCIDCRVHRPTHGLTKPLRQAIQATLDENQQVLLFINRRGFSPVWMCESCHWIAHCHHCDAHLTLHQKPNFLQCHHCGIRDKVNASCEQCHQTTMIAIGLGTERVEDHLQDSFPETKLIRIDYDSTRKKGQMQTYLNEIQTGEPAIIIGTQMIAKGHHFPNVALVGILHADNGLFSVDFRGIEKLGQLITQVAGRAGRDNTKGKVTIQTHHPEHPLLQPILEQDYAQFARLLLSERQVTQLPPFSYLALFRCVALDVHHATSTLHTVKQILCRAAKNDIKILGPAPAPMAKRAGKHRMQLLISSVSRTPLHQCLREAMPIIHALRLPRGCKWSLDVDPIEMV